MNKRAKNRFIDKPIHTFSMWSEMTVICPSCGKAGTVVLDREQQVAVFRCNGCYRHEKIVPCGGYDFQVSAQCTSTGKRFKKFLPQNQVHGSKQRVKCPYCNEFVVGDVQGQRESTGLIYKKVWTAIDPYFHYPLFFQTNFRGKTIWALNREHLQYLIEYLSADLRTVQPDYHQTYKTIRTQSDVLPAYMKYAKNREDIVKKLKKLQVEA